jgi:hypothetical protein
MTGESDMETKDIVSLTISLVSAVISVIIAMRAIDKQRAAQSFISNQDLLNKANTLLTADPGLWHLLGKEPDDVIKDGISMPEFTFIFASLSASLAHYIISGRRHAELTNERKLFLRNPKVRLAWKRHLRNTVFSTTSSWTKAVDTYIDDFESKGDLSRVKALA